MITSEAAEEYLLAFKQGTKESKDAAAAGRNPNPAVLDEMLEDLSTATVLDVGLVEIPTERIVGTRAAGRISAFSPSFLPLLSPLGVCQQVEEPLCRPPWAFRHPGTHPLL